MSRVQGHAPAKGASAAPAKAAKKTSAVSGRKQFDRDTAELIAKKAGDRAFDSVRDLLRFAQKDVPSLEDHNLRQLISRFPDVLGDFTSRAMHAPVPAEARARIITLALAHPTLDYAALAKLFAADKELKGVLPWSEDEVGRLREPSRILPSERKREDALAALAAAALSKSTLDLEGSAAAISEDYPGVTSELLLKLAPRSPPLAAAIVKLGAKGAAKESKPKATPLSLEQCRELKLSAELMGRALRIREDGLVAGIAAELEEISTNVGHNDQHLAPHDLSGASPRIKGVMAEVHEILGLKRLSLDAIDEVLPGVVAKIAERERKDESSSAPLYLSAARETIAVLSDDHRRAVHGEGEPVDTYYDRWKLSTALFQRFREVAPEAFPVEGAPVLSPERRARAAKLYAQLMDGELNQGEFFGRSKLSKAELLLLQTADPEHFPRPKDLPSHYSMAGKNIKAASEQLAESLAADFKAQVTKGSLSRGEFAIQAGITKHVLDQLMNGYPELLPRPARWTEGGPDEDALASLVGAVAKKVIEQDVLTSLDEVLAVVNAKSNITAKHGPISRWRYEMLRSNYPEEFPNLKDIPGILAVLKDEVSELLEKDQGLTPSELTALMQKRHPRFRLNRIYQLREAYPELIPSFAAVIVPKETRRSDAVRLVKAMTAEPEVSIRALAERWAKKEPRFNRDYLYRIRHEFAVELFSSGDAAYQAVASQRSTLKVAELLAEIIRLSEPGTVETTILARLNLVLVAEGLPPYEGSLVPNNLMSRLKERYGGFEEQGARAAAKVVTEYARAAKKGTSSADILAEVSKDYPSLDANKLAQYRALWISDPEAYGVDLTARGEKLKGARYLGGWDVERAIFKPAAHDPILAAELGRASQFLRMPRELPMLTEMVDELDGKTPLKAKNFLWVTHLLGSNVPLADALVAAGLKTSGAIVVGTPYGTNASVREAFEDRGFSVRVPALDSASFRQKVEEGLDAAVAEHKKNHQPIVVLDDGGLVAEILHSNPKEYGSVLGAFKIVEQTTRGITAAEERDLEVPIINVARSRSKSVEGALIGRAVPAKIEQALARVGESAAGKHVTVVGYGVIGEAIAKGLAEHQAKVTVVEASPARAAEAIAAGFEVTTLEEALGHTHILVGATGKESIHLSHLQALKSGSIVVSASSKQLEVDMKGLQKKAKRTLLPCDDPLVKLPTAKYQLGTKHLTVLGDGWPINFDGDVEDIPAEEIQLTRCAMFLGALQAASLKAHYSGSKRLIPLDEEQDERLYARFMSERKGAEQREIGDPARYLEDVRALAAQIGV